MLCSARLGGPGCPRLAIALLLAILATPLETLRQQGYVEGRNVAFGVSRRGFVQAGGLITYVPDNAARIR